MAPYDVVVFAIMALLVAVGTVALFSRSERPWKALRVVSTAVWVAGGAGLLAIGVLYWLWYLTGIGRP